MKTIITYASHYGSSQEYANWLSEALFTKAYEISKIKIDALFSYDMIIHIGGIYGSNVLGFSKIAKQLDALSGKTILLCMVGMTNPEEAEKYKAVYAHNVPVQYQERVKPFPLRGNQLFSKMSAMHRLMMRFPKSQITKKPQSEWTKEDHLFMESFGKDTYFVNKSYLNDIIAHVNALQNG